MLMRRALFFNKFFPFKRRDYEQNGSDDKTAQPNKDHSVHWHIFESEAHAIGGDGAAAVVYRVCKPRKRSRESQ